MEIVIVLGLIFVRRVQPIMIVLRLMIVTLIYSVKIMEIVGRYWFRYMLVLVIMRGILVIFTYIARLIPNEEFEILGLVNFIIILILISKKEEFFVIEERRIMSLKIWEVWLLGLNIYLVLYLLIIMVIVVWVGGRGGKSLRV